MASQVLSGATNASYTNNTGQNVRLIINYMANVTSMSWAGVNVKAESTTIGKDIQNITGEIRPYVQINFKDFDNFYVPLTVSRGGNFPVELMLAPNQSFSAVCGAFNAIVIKEDGT